MATYWPIKELYLLNSQLIILVNQFMDTFHNNKNQIKELPSFYKIIKNSVLNLNI